MKIRNCKFDVSDDRAGLNDAVLRHDDHAVANVVAVAIGVLDARFVDQAHVVADACIFVDNDFVEYDVLADAKPRRIAPRRRFMKRRCGWA